MFADLVRYALTENAFLFGILKAFLLTSVNAIPDTKAITAVSVRMCVSVCVYVCVYVYVCVCVVVVVVV